MAVNEPLNFEQPNNEMSQIAEMQRAMLFPSSDFLGNFVAFIQGIRSTFWQL